LVIVPKGDFGIRPCETGGSLSLLLCGCKLATSKLNFFLPTADCSDVDLTAPLYNLSA
jgi:hypothetical protein